MVVRSQALRDVCTVAERTAGGDVRVLITGESGVGKDLIAQLIHVRSGRRAGPFVTVNCAAFTETLLEAELFGHVKGSFTGAYRDRLGKAQMAHGGTLFLDEVGDMSPHMQALVLRFVETGEIQPVGADQPSGRVDVRIVAATNRDLGDAVASGRFREDLMYRLGVVRIHVPPLRERVADVRPLVEHVLSRIPKRVSLAEDVYEALGRYRWPGNVRELQNLIQQAVWTSGVELITLEQLPRYVCEGRGQTVPSRERRWQVADSLFTGLVSGHLSFWDDVYPAFQQRDLSRGDIVGLVRRGLASTGGNYRSTARLFGISPSECKRFMNFLATHGCQEDFRPFRLLSQGPQQAAETADERLEAAKNRLAELPAMFGPVPIHSLPDWVAKRAKARKTGRVAR